MKWYKLQEWKTVYSPLIKTLNSRVRQGTCVVFLLLSIVYVTIEGESDSEFHQTLENFLLSFFAGGGFTFLGVNILRFLPDRKDDSYLWRGWIVMGLFFSSNGIIALLIAFRYLILMVRIAL